MAISSHSDLGVHNTPTPDRLKRLRREEHYIFPLRSGAFLSCEDHKSRSTPHCEYCWPTQTGTPYRQRAYMRDHVMASSEILLIAVGSGLLALYGPKFDLLVIVCVVLLARFRGRVQALIAAATFSLVGLGAIATGHGFPQEFTRNGQFAAAISAIWCCALVAGRPKQTSCHGRI
jgi:hypothetical protein